MHQTISISTIRDFVKRWLHMHNLPVDQMRETVLVKNNDLYGYRFICHSATLDWHYGDNQIFVTKNGQQTVVTVADRTPIAA